MLPIKRKYPLNLNEFACAQSWLHLTSGRPLKGLEGPDLADFHQKGVTNSEGYSANCRCYQQIESLSSFPARRFQVTRYCTFWHCVVISVPYACSQTDKAFVSEEKRFCLLIELTSCVEH